MGRKVKRKVLSSAKKRSSTDLMFLLSVRAQPKPAGSGSAPEAFPSGGARRSQEKPGRARRSHGEPAHPAKGIQALVCYAFQLRWFEGVSENPGGEPEGRPKGPCTGVRGNQEEPGGAEGSQADDLRLLLSLQLWLSQSQHLALSQSQHLAAENCSDGN